jgi:ATP-dependent protease Clp ATPase subunit
VSVLQINFLMTDDGVRALARIAVKKNTGARGLRNVLVSGALPVIVGFCSTVLLAAGEAVASDHVCRARH